MIIKSYEIQKNSSNFLKYKIFLLYGENVGLKKDIKEFIKKTATQKDSKIEFLNLYENDITNNEKEFYNSIYSGSLFSNKKIITINNGTEKLFKHVSYVLDNYPENIYLIIFSDILEKKSKLRNLFEKSEKAYCIPCYLDSDKDLGLIAFNELKKNSISLSRESINLLIEKSNSDRNNLKNEIDKIKSFAHDKKEINFEELKSLINFSGEYKSDKLINECLCGNISQYKKVLSDLYTNAINQVFILRILSNKIRRLLNMKKMQDDYSNLDALLNATKPPIFWKEKPLIKKQLSIWSLNDLNTTLEEISNTELICKKNPNISKVIFFNFFSKICKKANNFS